eukprot:CAMPEP_0168523706 /NCGR_PEP_ID=MMETSP0405-20121227/10160_1 /TAXON_ID=498012 /ORGANISM="Trichosphaerium sp, Strain Am-I-7 wt" /LENGTH=349 /DNA_ID=CAMNT_0008545665 /DNA_START=88 /DNA_END=1134 /DNA_ORIENTATION=+
MVQCRKFKVPSVSLVDKKQLLEYLEGKIADCPQIDKSLDVPTILEQQDVDMTDAPDRNVAPQAEEEPDLTKPMELSQKEQKEREEHAMRLERRKRSSNEQKSEGDVRSFAEELGVSADKLKQMKKKRGKRKRGEVTITIDTSIPHRDTTFIKRTSTMTRAIIKRERPLYTRETILQSNAKSFVKLLDTTKDILKMQTKPTKRRRYNRYEFEEKKVLKEKLEVEEFEIDTRGSNLSKKPAQHRDARESSRSSSRHRRESSRSSKVLGTPIIIVPNDPTAVINISNVRAFLQDGQFKPTHKTGRKEQLTMLTAPNGTKYEVIDSATRLERRDWARIKAVFAQGPKWQFKNW